MWSIVMVVGAFLGVWGLTRTIRAYGDILAFIDEYESMTDRGYMLMKDENGEEFWVGYGD